MVTFTLKVQVVQCAIEHTFNTCKMRPGFGSVLDLANFQQRTTYYCPSFKPLLQGFDYIFFMFFFFRSLILDALDDDAWPDNKDEDAPSDNAI